MSREFVSLTSSGREFCTEQEENLFFGSQPCPLNITGSWGLSTAKSETIKHIARHQNFTNAHLLPDNPLTWTLLRWKSKYLRKQIINILEGILVAVRCFIARGDGTWDSSPRRVKMYPKHSQSLIISFLRSKNLQLHNRSGMNLCGNSAASRENLL